ncbi:MAG: glycosyltransferase [Chloroflexi bacterium]|nr:glycosyltransferase [Chloroflexota bacterium]
MPRVLYLVDSLNNGGAERQFALLVKSLPEEWDRQVWSMYGGPFADTIRDMGVPLRTRARAWRFDIAPALDLWHSILRWKPDVVHSWGWMCSVSAGPMCKLLGIPFVDGTIRSGSIIPGRTLGRRFGIMLADRVIANSQAGLSAWQVGQQKGRVVHNGFDPDRLAQCTRVNQQEERPFTVVMTGRMSPHKDFAAFARAARALADLPGQKWRFLAVGDGPDRTALVNDVKELIDSDIVSLPEPRIEVLDVVRKAHIGVLMTKPPVVEGCSNSIMEYMACSLPVICSAGGGNQELVLDGKTGFLVPPSDGEVLAERLMWLRSHPEERERMGMAGRERIVSGFTVGAMVEKTISVYQEIGVGLRAGRCKEAEPSRR